MGWGDIVKGFLGNTSSGYEVAYDPYQSVREPLLNWLSGQIGTTGQSYTGQLVAPMSSEESKSLDFLNSYGASSIKDNANYQSASKVLSDTLNNKYDPASSAYYQAIKAESARNLADTKESIASDAAGGGNLWTGARLREQGRAATDSAISLNKTLGELALQERQNQLAAVQDALNFATTEQSEDLSKASAFQLYGSLPRTIQQAQNEADYNEWLRTNVEYPLQIAQLASGVQQAPTYVQSALSNSAALGQLFRSNYDNAQKYAIAAAGCWVAKEIFGSWEHPKTIRARHYINVLGPKWFKNFYWKYGEQFANYISNKPIIKSMLRPLFELFALIGEEQSNIGLA